MLLYFLVSLKVCLDFCNMKMGVALVMVDKIR